MIRRRNDDEERQDDPPAQPPPSGPVVIEYIDADDDTGTVRRTYVVEDVNQAGDVEVVEAVETAVTTSPPPAPAPDPEPTAGTALATTPQSSPEVQESIEAIRLLTALLVGGAIEGADQLVTRLRKYEQELELLAAAEAAQRAAQGQQRPDPSTAEDELDRLRYTIVGFVFEAQNRLGRGIYSAARVTDSSLETANNLTRPFRNFFLFRPITSRIEERIENLVEYGRESLDRWAASGRELEPRSRDLATRTYEEIVDEFINMLAENEEIKELVATQSIGLVQEVRDNVRGRTVTGDSVVEDLVRRVLRRSPREDLPEPPPEVQRWAGVNVTQEQSGESSEPAADSEA